jgi:hypothetical protein
VDNLIAIVTLLIALSVASERLVDIVKGLVPFLNVQNKDAKKEGWRKTILQVMAVISGIITAFLARGTITSAIPEIFQTTSGILGLGLLASGGSGLWNAVLTYLLQVKNLKKATATDAAKKLEG